MVVSARRTPIGTAGHAYKSLTAEHLAAPVIAAVAGDLKGRPVDDVMLGNCMGPGGNIARVSALAAGLGHEVPGVTVDRQCGSGLAAILLAGQAVRAGEADLVIAGGVESASTAPLRTFRGAGTPYERAPFTPEGSPDPDMGPAAEVLAAAKGVDRERQDAYACRSHARALAARAAGRFAEEIVPVAGRTDDQRPRPLRAASLARLPAAFVPGGTVTAGNSSPNSDGAAAVALVPEGLRDGLPGLRLLAGAVAGCDPKLPGWGGRCRRSAGCWRVPGWRWSRSRWWRSWRRSRRRCWPSPTRSGSTRWAPTTSGCVPAAVRWRSGIRGARPARWW
ncbi:hypothetical protein GCM10020001_105820 [Nonomuraea salmonea]